mgnify:CR=1 FL=1
MSISSINQNVQQNNKSSYVKKGLLGTGIGAAGGAAAMGAFSYIDIQNTKGFIPNKDTFMQQFKDEDMFKQIEKQLNESIADIKKAIPKNLVKGAIAGAAAGCVGAIIGTAIKNHRAAKANPNTKPNAEVKPETKPNKETKV